MILWFKDSYSSGLLHSASEVTFQDIFVRVKLPYQTTVHNKEQTLRIILCICSTLTIFSGIILSMGSANERRRYYVTPSLIGWTHTQNDPCIQLQMRLYWNVFVSTCLFIWNNFHSWSCMSCGIIYMPHETIHRKWYWTTIQNFKISTGYHKRDVTSVY